MFCSYHWCDRSSRPIARNCDRKRRCDADDGDGRTRRDSDLLPTKTERNVILAMAAAKATAIGIVRFAARFRPELRPNRQHDERVEELHAVGMLCNRRLARSIADECFGEFRRQLSYKTVICGARLEVTGRFFSPSTIRGCSRIA